MAYNFLECNYDQMYLMPVSMRDWLPEDDLAWFILDVVEEFDLTPFYQRYRVGGWGEAAYKPGMMVSLLLYAYSLGIRSSRQIERACKTDVAFRVIAGNQKPDYLTICRFRKVFEAEFGELCTEVLRLCVEAGLVKVGVLALDGMRVKVSTSLSANPTYEYLEKEVEQMLREAEVKDVEEDALYGKDRGGDELPEKLTHRESQLARLKEAKAQLEQQADGRTSCRKSCSL